MTEKDREIQELRRTVSKIKWDYEYLTQSETVRFYLQKNAKGEFIHDISALDRGIRDLHARCRKAEKEAQSSKAEAVYYRRKTEDLELERKEDEENRFPIFKTDDRADEDQHQEA